MDRINQSLETIGLALLALLICAGGLAWLDGTTALIRQLPVLAVAAVVVVLLGIGLAARQPGHASTGEGRASHGDDNTAPLPGDAASPGTPPAMQPPGSAAAVVAATASQSSSDTVAPGNGMPRHTSHEYAYAQALHDEVRDHVASVRSMGQAIARRATDPAIREASSAVLQSADQLDAVINRVLIRHTGSQQQTSGLSGAVTELVNAVGAGSKADGEPPRVVLRISPEVDAVPAAVADTGLRIVRDALDNALTHAGASRIEINLRVLDDHLVLQVSDNGVGLPETITRRRGLDAMAASATSLGGEFQVGKSRMGGAIARARLPVAIASPAARAVGES